MGIEWPSPWLLCHSLLTKNGIVLYHSFLAFWKPALWSQSWLFTVKGGYQMGTGYWLLSHRFAAFHTKWAFHCFTTKPDLGEIDYHPGFQYAFNTFTFYAYVNRRVTSYSLSVFEQMCPLTPSLCWCRTKKTAMFTKGTSLGRSEDLPISILYLARQL